MGGGFHTIKLEHDAAVLKDRPKLGPHMDDLAGKIDQLWMPIKRKHVAFSERQDCPSWLFHLECPKAGSCDHVVDSQSMRTETRPGVTLDAILFGLGRGSHCNAVIVEPTGRTLLGQTRVER